MSLQQCAQIPDVSIGTSKHPYLYIGCMLLHRRVSENCQHGTGNERPSTLKSWIDVSATVCTDPRCLHRHGCSKPSAWAKRQKNFHCTRDAVCVTCDDKILCKLCQKSLPVTAVDPDTFLKWQKNFHYARDAVCVTCEDLDEDDKVLCRRCQKSLPVTAFDRDKLLNWRKNFNCSRDAVCVTCDAQDWNA